ncbi:uncharacterized protein LOC134284972 isoform X2 [Aedes albopictus]
MEHRSSELMSVLRTTNDPSQFAAAIRDGTEMDLTCVKAVPEVLKALNIHIPKLVINVHVEKVETYRFGAEQYDFDGVDSCVTVDLELRDNHYQLRGSSEPGMSEGNNCLYAALATAIPQLSNTSAEDFRRRMADCIETNSETRRYIQLGQHHALLQSGIFGGMVLRRRSRSTHEDLSRVTSAKEHLLARFEAIFDMAGLVQHYADYLRIDRSEVLRAGPSQYQDRSSSDPKLHAAHVTRVQISQRVEDNEQSLILVDYLKTQVGHTHLVEKWANVWGGVAQDIDLLQVSLIGLLEEVDFFQNPPGLTQGFENDRLKLRILKINRQLHRREASKITLPDTTTATAIAEICRQVFANVLHRAIKTMKTECFRNVLRDVHDSITAKDADELLKPGQKVVDFVRLVQQHCAKTGGGRITDANAGIAITVRNSGEGIEAHSGIEGGSSGISVENVCGIRCSSGGEETRNIADDDDTDCLLIDEEEDEGRGVDGEDEVAMECESTENARMYEADGNHEMVQDCGQEGSRIRKRVHEKDYEEEHGGKRQKDCANGDEERLDDKRERERQLEHEKERIREQNRERERERDRERERERERERDREREKERERDRDRKRDKERKLQRDRERYREQERNSEIQRQIERKMERERMLLQSEREMECERAREREREKERETARDRDRERERERMRQIECNMCEGKLMLQTERERMREKERMTENEWEHIRKREKEKEREREREREWEREKERVMKRYMEREWERKRERERERVRESERKCFTLRLKECEVDRQKKRKMEHERGCERAREREHEKEREREQDWQYERERGIKQQIECVIEWMMLQIERERVREKEREIESGWEHGREREMGRYWVSERECVEERERERDRERERMRLIESLTEEIMRREMKLERE